MLKRSTACGAGTSGIGQSFSPQVWRRTAVTAVAVVLTCIRPSASRWRISIVQCWVERLVRAGCATISNSPSVTAAAKFTVSATGSPSSSGWRSTACSASAAVMPPKGPTMFQ